MFFEQAEFICYGDGTLTDTDEQSSFLSFLRLVGSAYFRKHKSVFLPSFPTPKSLFNSFTKGSTSPLSHISQWLDAIRERVWSRIKYEEEMVPSIGALERHWKRSCYVINIWKQAAHNTMSYPLPQNNGWKFDENKLLLIDWDSCEHISHVRNRVALIQKGCGCKTGCASNRCKCKKNDVYCGPGCTCDNCENHPIDQHLPDLAEIEREENGVFEDMDEEVDNIMCSVFGVPGYSSTDSDDDIDVL